MEGQNDLKEVLRVFQDMQKEKSKYTSIFRTLMKDNVILNQELVKARKRIKKLEISLLGVSKNE